MAVPDHVAVISIGGLRPDAIEKFGATTLQRRMREGSYSRNARTILHGGTLPSHTSMLTGEHVEARLARERPNPMFVHFGEPDYAGHGFGWMSWPYARARWKPRREGGANRSTLPPWFPFPPPAASRGRIPGTPIRCKP